MNIKEEYIYDLLLKEKQNTLTISEQDDLKALRANEETRTTLNELQLIIQASEYPTITDRDHNKAWNGLQAEISGNQVDVKIPIEKNPRNRYFLISGIAASLAILVSCLFWWNQQDQFDLEYRSHLGSRKTMTLVDGSVVHLNGGSVLAVSDDFGTKNRTLNLTGEAYFEVAKNKDLAFIVRTENLKTEVTGTKFVVCDYPHQMNKYVKLHEGGLNVSHRDEKTKIKPGQQTMLQNDKLLVGKFELIDSLPSWTKETLNFKNSPVSKVIESVENFYGIEIENKVDLGDLHYSHKFEGATLDHVLKTFTKSVGCQFQKKSDKKYLIIKSK